jgi:hypothetical protein
MKMAVADSSETAGIIYDTTLRHIPQRHTEFPPPRVSILIL